MWIEVISPVRKSSEIFAIYLINMGRFYLGYHVAGIYLFILKLRKQIRIFKLAEIETDRPQTLVYRSIIHLWKENQQLTSVQSTCIYSCVAAYTMAWSMMITLVMIINRHKYISKYVPHLIHCIPRYRNSYIALIKAILADFLSLNWDTLLCKIIKNRCAIKL